MRLDTRMDVVEDYELEKIPLGQLVFDPNNPRLPPSIEGGNDEDVLEWMLSDSGLLELMGSIATHGYFPGDPMLISPQAETDAPPTYDEKVTYVVVEGNRRLAAVRLLRGDMIATKRKKSVQERIDQAGGRDFSTIPSVLFPHRDEVLDYLGFRHITGVKEWDPLEKARFLKQLRDRDSKPPSNTELARAIGSKSGYVGRLLVALALLEKLAKSPALAAADVKIDDVPFSLLVASLNHKAIANEFLGLERADEPGLEGLDHNALESLGRWLFVKREGGKTALEDSRNLRLLGEVVRSGRAIDALDAGMSIRDAALVAHDPVDVIGAALGEARRPLGVASRQVGNLDKEAPTDLVKAAAEVREIAGEVEAGLRDKSSTD
jgi:hypothetical protein